MFPGGAQALTTAILALCGLRRNGTGGPGERGPRFVTRAPWPVFRDSCSVAGDSGSAILGTLRERTARIHRAKPARWRRVWLSHCRHPHPGVSASYEVAWNQWLWRC